MIQSLTSQRNNELKEDVKEVINVIENIMDKKKEKEGNYFG